MKKKIIRPTAKWKLAAGLVLAFVFLLVSTLIFSMIVTPKPVTAEQMKNRWSPEVVKAAEKTLSRPKSLDGLRSVIIQTVSEKDYERTSAFMKKNPDAAPEQVEAAVQRGEIPRWYPREQSPVLDSFVKSGKLEPVASRVGPEPLVTRPLEGVHNYGGVWLMYLNGPSTGIVGFQMERINMPTLFRFSPTGYPIVPNLAKSYEVKEGGRVWEVTLRKARWSDGAPFTAEDILYWYNDEVFSKVRKSSGKLHDYFMDRQGQAKIEKIDDHRFRCTFYEPRGDFLEYMCLTGYITIRPSHYMKKFHPKYADMDYVESLRKKYALRNEHEVYNYMGSVNNPELPTMGPWMLRRYRTMSPISYVRNPYYFAVDEDGRQLPYIDRFQIELVDAKMLPMFAGNGRATFQPVLLRPSHYTELAAKAEENNFRILGWLAGIRCNWTIHPTIDRYVTDKDPQTELKAKLLARKEFRQALSMGIDRGELVRSVFEGQADPGQVDPGPYSEYSSEKLRNAFAKLDPMRANRMLDDLWREFGLDPSIRKNGYRVDRNGNPLNFYLLFGDKTGGDPAQFVVDDWKNHLGIRCIAQGLSSGLLMSRRNLRDLDFFVYDSGSDNVPYLAPQSFVAANGGANYALRWAHWVQNGGMMGLNFNPKRQFLAVPEDHPMFEALTAFNVGRRSTDPEVRRRSMERILDIACENTWNIGTGVGQLVIMVASKNAANIPEKAVDCFSFMSPGHTVPETFSLHKPEDFGTLADTSEQLERAEALPAAQASSSWLTVLLRTLAIGIVVLLIVMIALRHPFVLRRLTIMIPTLLIVSVCIFTIIQLPPGDYLTVRLQQLQESGLSEAEIEVQLDRLREIFHFDDPAWKRYCRWMGFNWFLTFESADQGLLQGHMGYSMETVRPVNQMVGDRIWLTMLVSVLTILFTWAIALPVGIYTAVRQYSIIDYILTLVAFLGMCVPSFLLVLVLMAWTGIDGLFSAEYAMQPYWDLAKVVDMLGHIWLPVLVTGIGGSAGMIRVMRANLLDELRKPYVITARAKGVRPGRLLFKYPVRLALNPFISGIGGLFPSLISGSSIIAIVMSLPTVGPLMLAALFNQDMNMAGSMLMVLSSLAVFGTLVSDLLLMVVDPRIRIGGK